VNAAIIRFVLAAGAAALVASCSVAPSPNVSTKQRSKEYFSEREYGPASPRVVQSHEKVPKGGGRAMVGQPYRVAGKTYIPRDNPRYSAVGMASWYGSAFHGRLTANGEVYDVNGLTAAHPTLPLPSYVRVTNLENGRSLMVRVNDRGPFASDRIIDLSARVADMLEVKNKGTAKVKVDYVGPARMDGLDEKMLLASYSGPGGFNKRDRSAPNDAVMVASARPPAPRARPAAPQPVYPPADDDPLAPLIMRASLAISYAPDAKPTDAQRAAAALAASANTHDTLQAALDRAAARKARELAGGPAGETRATVIQLGAFADPANAERLADGFRQFGTVQSVHQQSGDRTLTVVRLVLADPASSDTVIAAAGRAGLSGAFVLHR
jgi:rare lipoprotein A